MFRAIKLTSINLQQIHAIPPRADSHNYRESTYMNPIIDNGQETTTPNHRFLSLITFSLSVDREVRFPFAQCSSAYVPV